MVAISKTLKLAAMVGALAVLALAFVSTYKHGYTVAKALGDTALANFKAQQQNAAAEAAKQAFGKYADDVQRGQRAESQFLADRSAATAQVGNLKERIDAVAQTHIPDPPRASSAAAGAPVYRCVFTRGFVRVWNDAAGITGDSNGAMSDRTDAGDAAGIADADAAADAGVSQQDVLDWFIDYAARVRTTELKLKGVRDALPAQQDQP